MLSSLPTSPWSRKHGRATNTLYRMKLSRIGVAVMLFNNGGYRFSTGTPAARRLSGIERVLSFTLLGSTNV